MDRYTQRKSVRSSFAFVEGDVLYYVAVGKRTDLHMQIQEEGTRSCKDQHLFSLM